eukprot:COSAG02_NODE_67179_length_253_cov_1.136364_1_plen_26_part_10
MEDGEGRLQRGPWMPYGRESWNPHDA